MSQVVSKQSLDALATMAFLTIFYEDDPNAKPEYNMEHGSAAALFKLIQKDRHNECDGPFFNGFTEGAEFGLAVAAAILTNGLDNNATADALRVALVASSLYWPKSKEEAA